MRNKLGLLLSLGALVVLVGAGCAKSNTPAVTEENKQPVVEETQTVPDMAKEFTMTAYYDPEQKKSVFSLPEMAVKKGEKVRIKITNTKGMHDFVIDELGVSKELPLDEEVVIEFTADKAGAFVYYCSKPGHRASGQWGTLKVVDDSQPAASSGEASLVKPGGDVKAVDTGRSMLTMAEVAKHNVKEDCYMVVRGDVYDVTGAIDKHPGGPEALIKQCGKDATAAFTGQHGGEEKPEGFLATLKIGTLQK